MWPFIDGEHLSRGVDLKQLDADSLLSVLENYYIEDVIKMLPVSEEAMNHRNQMRLEFMRYNRNNPGFKSQQDNDDQDQSVEYVEPTEFGYPGLESGLLE